MQKLFMLFLIAAMGVSLVGCSGGNTVASVPTNAAKYEAKEPDAIKNQPKEGDPRKLSGRGGR